MNGCEHREFLLVPSKSTLLCESQYKPWLHDQQDHIENDIWRLSCQTGVIREFHVLQLNSVHCVQKKCASQRERKLHLLHIHTQVWLELLDYWMSSEVLRTWKSSRCKFILLDDFVGLFYQTVLLRLSKYKCAILQSKQPCWLVVNITIADSELNADTDSEVHPSDRKSVRGRLEVWKYYLTRSYSMRLAAPRVSSSPLITKRKVWSYILLYDQHRN